MSGAWEWDAEQVRAHVAAVVPGAWGRPERLTGGLLNVVWRVRSTDGNRSVIAKIAPPFVASLPDVPLAQSRQRIEAAALAAFVEDGPLVALSDDRARPPRPLHHDPDTSVLVMEDVGALPDLAAALEAGLDPEALGEALGRFVGRLHAASLNAPWLPAFDNADAQQTRLEVQYRAVADILRQSGVADADALGADAVALGERLLQPGRCLIQGDLWPPSVLVGPGPTLRVIDWELAHAGAPAQDLGHLLAHLWMIEHCLPRLADAARRAAVATLDAYAGAAGHRLPSLLAGGTQADAARHAACEVLVRAAGPFQRGYLYDGLESDSSAVRDAMRVAVSALRNPTEGFRLSRLR